MTTETYRFDPTTDAQFSGIDQRAAEAAQAETKGIRSIYIFESEIVPGAWSIKIEVKHAEGGSSINRVGLTVNEVAAIVAEELANG